MRFATWNVNSIRQRQAHVCRWLRDTQPDLLLLQEIKCEEASFPADAFREQGYAAAVVGQKSYNGVAVLSRIPFTVKHRALPGLPTGDAQARYLEVEAEGITFGNLYLPNGNSGGAAGYEYKLRWMDALLARAQQVLAADQPLVLAGDFNVCPTDDDLAAGALPAQDALCRPETRARFRALLWSGLTDALRALHPAGKTPPFYTFWDYQAGAWPRDRGLRIDHALLSAGVAERLLSADPQKMERDRESPSDHVPLVISIASPSELHVT